MVQFVDLVEKQGKFQAKLWAMKSEFFLKKKVKCIDVLRQDVTQVDEFGMFQTRERGKKKPILSVNKRWS